MTYILDETINNGLEIITIYLDKNNTIKEKKMKLITIENRMYKISNEDFGRFEDFPRDDHSELLEFLEFLESKYKIYGIIDGTYNY